MYFHRYHSQYQYFLKLKISKNNVKSKSSLNLLLIQNLSLNIQVFLASDIYSEKKYKPKKTVTSIYSKQILIILIKTSLPSPFLTIGGGCFYQTVMLVYPVHVLYKGNQSHWTYMYIYLVISSMSTSMESCFMWRSSLSIRRFINSSFKSIIKIHEININMQWLSPNLHSNVLQK